jgi:coenzyme F420 hydrogenase subunit beta
MNAGSDGMEMSSRGFLHPQLSREMNKEEMTLFQSYCPGIGLMHPVRNSTHTALWGPVKKTGIGYACDKDVRFKASSGGMVSALAIYLLENKLVKGVLHIVASKQDPLENISQISYTIDEVIDAAGSRYAPAAPLTKLADCINLEGVFAFIGKPCDVAALRALARKRPEILVKFPYMISFMCAGTPSLHGSEQVVQRLGFQIAELCKFRYRGNGWPGKAVAETTDGRRAEMDYHVSWGQILNRYLPYRCKVCADGTGEFADISCADAWAVDKKGYPVFTESYGRNLVMIRTEIGNQLIQEARSQARIQFEAITLEEAEKMQPYQIYRKKTMLARLLGFRLAGKMTPTYRNMGLLSAARNVRIIEQSRAFIGAMVRGLKG